MIVSTNTGTLWSWHFISLLFFSSTGQVGEGCSPLFSAPAEPATSPQTCCSCVSLQSKTEGRVTHSHGPMTSRKRGASREPLRNYWPYFTDYSRTTSFKAPSEVTADTRQWRLLIGQNLGGHALSFRHPNRRLDGHLLSLWNTQHITVLLKMDKTCNM